MNLTCPCCHSRYSIDAVLQDEAARDLLALRGTLPPRIWNPLIAYLGLFRSENRALAWDRALKLTRDIQEMGNASGEWDKLENALAETVESLRQRSGKPLKNHNYLKRVLENAQDSGVRVKAFNPEPRTPSSLSKAAQAAMALREWGASDWIREQIAVGLSAMIAMNLKHTPAAEIITANADIWHVSLKKSLTIETVDAPRIGKAFEQLIPALTEWPQPKQLIDLLPPRPVVPKLRHEASESDRQAGLKALREFQEQYK